MVMKLANRLLGITTAVIYKNKTTNMKNLELNIEKIKLISKEKEVENFRFRAFLKGLDSEKVDKIVQKLNEEIVSQIDCQNCGNCCKLLSSCLSDSEIITLSKIDKVSKEDYICEFVEKDDSNNKKYLKDIPCRYLKDNSCTIYESRPLACKSYPHTQKKNFTSRTIKMIENYEICPIVFNLYELLKLELNFIR